jgi:hypothetical protein
VPYSNRKIWHIVNECADLESEMKVFRGQKNTLRDVLDATAYQLDIVKEIYPEQKKSIYANNNKRVDLTQLTF